MGKKGKKKSFYKKSFKPFVADNKVIIAALGGAAAGITLATILGTEKARQIVNTIEESVKDFSGRVKNELGRNSYDEKELIPAKKNS